MTELETMQRAKMYLDKLARGIDPITDREVPEDTVLNHVRICRCLHYVSGVLEQVIANGGTVGKREGTPFVIDRSKMGRIRLTQNPVSLTEFTGNIVACMDDPNMKRPNPKAITGWLTQRGLMELTTDYERHWADAALTDSKALEEKPVEELFTAFYTERNNGQTPDEQDLAFLTYAAEQIRSTDTHGKVDPAQVERLLQHLLKQEGNA